MASTARGAFVPIFSMRHRVGARGGAACLEKKGNSSYQEMACILHERKKTHTKKPLHARLSWRDTKVNRLVTVVDLLPWHG